MSLEGKFDALMRQNEMLMKKINEDTQLDQETKAQNESQQDKLHPYLTKLQSFKFFPFNKELKLGTTMIHR